MAGDGQRPEILKRAALLTHAALVASLLVPIGASARQNSIDGTLSFGNTYESNVFRSESGRVSEGRSQLAPRLTYLTLGPTDSLTLTYASELSYNRRRQDKEITQSLSVVEEKGLSARWKVTVSGNYTAYDTLFFEAGSTLSVTQNFLRADSATQAEIVRILFPELTFDPAGLMGMVVSQLQNRFESASPSQQAQVKQLLFQGGSGARQRYWTTQLAVSSQYEFSDKGRMVVGWRLSGQDHKTGEVADHLAHHPTLLFSYQFDRQWQAQLGYDLSFDSYDTSSDSTTNHPHLRVDFHLSPRNLLFWRYDYRQIEFAETGRDTRELASKIGWDRHLDRQTSVTTTLGSTYHRYEATPDEREYTLDLSLAKELEHGRIAMRASGLTAVALLDRGTERSRQSWEVSGTLTYQPRQEWSVAGRASYGQWRSWPVGVGQDRNPYDQLQLGAGVQYPWARWFTLAFDYDYYLFDTNSLILNDYTEHLLSLKLVGAKELWRW